MQYKADFHCHSTSSDGQFSPSRLVAMQKQAGTQVMALTDHDTLSGTDEAIQAAQSLGGIQVIRGIELGAAEHRKLHIVGLGMNGQPSKLTRLCDILSKSRDDRKYRLCTYLAEKGVPVCLEEVEALAGGNVGRPHFAQIMVAHGYVSTTREAFDRYLDTPDFQKIERYKAPAKDCIEAIHDAGGKAVLAHPYQLGYSNQDLDSLLAKLVSFGLDAMECYYPKHTPQQVQFYLSLVEKHGLHISGGTDFHGPAVHPEDVLNPVLLETNWVPCLI